MHTYIYICIWKLSAINVFLSLTLPESLFTVDRRVRTSPMVSSSRAISGTMLPLGDLSFEGFPAVDDSGVETVVLSTATDARRPLVPSGAGVGFP